MDGIRYCQECVHYKSRPRGFEPVCLKYKYPKEVPTVDKMIVKPKRDKLYRDHYYCIAARKDEGRCGLQGKDFERKKTQWERLWVRVF